MTFCYHCVFAGALRQGGGAAGYVGLLLEVLEIDGMRKTLPIKVLARLAGRWVEVSTGIRDAAHNADWHPMPGDH